MDEYFKDWSGQPSLWRARLCLTELRPIFGNKRTKLFCGWLSATNTVHTPKN